MEELKSKLDDIGLQEYYDMFVDEGFDNWDTVLDITESDLESLKVKLGHRRKLQRAIYMYRRSIGQDDTQSDFYSGAPSPDLPATKRKYKRHPKPDTNAPEKPHSAYVLFSNDVRKELDKDVSFADMAKIVGERWQALEAGIRQSYETEAIATKTKYQEQLAEYKKTAQYREYQAYLADFKAKSRPHATDNESATEAPLSHSRASSTSEMASLLERTGVVSFSDTSRVSARKSIPDDHTPRPIASSKTRTTPASLSTSRTSSAIQPSSPQLLSSQPSPSSSSTPQRHYRRSDMNKLLETLPPNFRRDSSSGGTSISNSGFELTPMPLPSVEPLLPRPVLSNTRMSSTETSERSEDWDVARQKGSQNQNASPME